MDQSLVAQILRQSRGKPADTGSSPQMASPFLPNQGLEQQAMAQGQTPMHPLIAEIMKRFGLLNMLRNRGNEQMVAGI